MSGVEKQLRELYEQKRQEKKETFNRSLAFGDYFTDRWERARSEGFGEGTSVYDNVLIIGDVKIGKHTWIGPNVVLDGSGGLEIGDYCAIGAGSQIYTHDSSEWSITLGKGKYKYLPTKIGNGVHISANVIVMPGVEIGDQCIIGASALITKTVPPRSRAHGVPAKVVGEVTIPEVA